MQPVFVRSTKVTTSWGDKSKSLQELIFDCVSKALRSANIRAADLDAVVLGAHDLVDGRGLTSMVTAPAAAAYLKDENRLGEDGAAAFVLGDARVRSGAARYCLVASWGRASEGPQDDIARALFDPFLSRPFGMTELMVSGMRASRALIEHPGYEDSRDAAAGRRAPRPADPARTPPPAWPLRPAELPVWSDVVSAIVLSSDETPVEVRGVGMSTEAFDPGERDLLALPALRSASAQALVEADVAAASIDALELDGLTLFDEALALEAVGVAERGQGMRALATETRVDPHAASAIGYCAPAMGLARIARASERLIAGGSGTALATGSSVVAAQTQAAVVLSRK